MNTLLTFISALLFSATVLAQTGSVRGQLVDAENGDALIGALVEIEGTTKATFTDVEGQYSIAIEPGSYTVKHSYVGYQDKSISEVVITADQVTSLDIVTLDSGSEQIEAVVITYSAQKNTEEGLLNFQKNSTKIVDAISAQSIAKSGDGNVGAIVKRVPGVTVEGGKYVFVRGLGDRYSKSILNGMEIPGLDPERNTVQMDIFSANIVDNIVVYKTFSPDLPGDFTGGMVDVITKDFPLEKSFQASVSAGFNSETTFNDSYIGYEGTSFQDVIGFGRESRKRTFSKFFDPITAADNQLNFVTDGLNKSAAVTPQDNFFNQKVALSYGNQFEVGENAIGVVGAVNYTNNFGQQNNWVRNDINFISGQEDFENSAFRSGAVGTNDGMLNGLLNGAYKFNRGKVGVKLMHTRTGENAVSFRQLDDQFDDQLFEESIIDYFQRTISNGVVSGDFYLGENQDMLLDVAFAGTYSSIDNPERTAATMFVDPQDGSYTFASNSDFNKEWRELEEYNMNGKFNFELPIAKASGLNSMVKFGGAYNYKERDFEPIQIEITPSNFFNSELAKIPNNDLNYILQSENIINVGQEGYTVDVVKIDLENKFNADMAVAAGYGMLDYKLNEQMQFIGGLRVENAIMNFDGFVDNEVFQRETLNSTQFLPSANLVFSPNEDMKFRGSYNRTLARPSFKEKSQANIFDAILNQFYIGNIDLVETTVDNFDARWEHYFGKSELISFSPFMKRFQNPIELSFINADQVTPINKPDAEVLGFEFELRKDFGFINEKWEDVKLNTNFTLVDSKIDLTPNEQLKYGGIDVPSDRVLMGQAPFAVNANLGYTGFSNGWEANLGYNVKGKTLTIVGFSTQTYDIYEDPFHNLDLKVSKQLGDQLGSKLSLTARNLANDNIEFVYDYRDQEVGTFNAYDIGQTFTVGYSLSLGN